MKAIRNFEQLSVHALAGCLIVALAAAMATRAGTRAIEEASAGDRDRARAAAPPVRDLRLWDRGGDVKTLNWALRAQGHGAPYHGTFEKATEVAVRSVQAGAGITADGVVRRDTRQAIAARMPAQGATWYGPGLYGRRTACGVTLTKRTVGVAHRTLPCGTRVAFANRGRWGRARVIDRGPFRPGHDWDLTKPLAKRLGAIRAGTAKVRTGVAK
jgi:rare lipoprotein A (peptidoglycan hydrolase)